MQILAYISRVAGRLAVRSAAVLLLLMSGWMARAQSDVHVTARMDARQITIGDQARLFIEASNTPNYVLHWPVIPDTFNNLEVVERGRIDTVHQGGVVIFKQRLLITGFDSGLFKVPSFVFTYSPGNGGAPVTALSDSFMLTVQTVAVDTTQGFKGIKGIMYVRSSWRDYIILIIGAVAFLALLVFVVLYFARNRKIALAKRGPVESLQDYALRLLAELEMKQLWQKKQVKEHYVALTDVVRNYIEHRFDTPVLELTTEELLDKAGTDKDLRPHYDLLAHILQTADLAKFAKFQPDPAVHAEVMDKAKQLINDTRPSRLAAGDTNNATA